MEQIITNKFAQNDALAVQLILAGGVFWPQMGHGGGVVL